MRLEENIREYETKLKTEETRYSDAVHQHQSYDILKAIRNDIRDIKQQLQVLYNVKDKKT